MQKLTMAVGKWVVGEQFWGREVDVKLFTELLDDGSDILLVAQRRMGKTSLMHEVARIIDDKYICLNVDLQSTYTPEEAIVKMSMATHPHRDLWGKTKAIFGNITNTITDHIDSVQALDVALKLKEGINAGDWNIKGDKLFNTLALADKPVVVFLDEVPILISRILRNNDAVTQDGIKAADKFMSWLRENSSRHTGKVRIVVTGSIGLEPVLHQAGLSATINSLTPFELKPWDKDTAIGCLRALANGKNMTFEDGVCEHMVEKLGCCIPYHVQLYFKAAYELCARRKNMAFTLNDADTVYQEDLLSTRGNAELKHYEERFKDMLDANTIKLAYDILTETAISGRLTEKATSMLLMEYDFGDKRPNEVLRELMDILEHDGYLKKDGKAHVFVSCLMRDWWCARYGSEFIPTAERKQ